MRQGRSPCTGAAGAKKRRRRKQQKQKQKQRQRKKRRRRKERKRKNKRKRKRKRKRKTQKQKQKKQKKQTKQKKRKQRKKEGKKTVEEERGGNLSPQTCLPPRLNARRDEISHSGEPLTDLFIYRFHMLALMFVLHAFQRTRLNLVFVLPYRTTLHICCVAAHQRSWLEMPPKVTLKRARRFNQSALTCRACEIWHWEIGCKHIGAHIIHNVRCVEIVPHNMIVVPHNIGGWGEDNREIVSFRACDAKLCVPVRR